MQVKEDFWLHVKWQDIPHTWPHWGQEEEEVSSDNQSCPEEPLGWGRSLDPECPQDVTYNRLSRIVCWFLFLQICR